MTRRPATSRPQSDDRRTGRRLGVCVVTASKHSVRSPQSVTPVTSETQDSYDDHDDDEAPAKPAAAAAAGSIGLEGRLHLRFSEATTMNGHCEDVSYNSRPPLFPRLRRTIRRPCWRRGSSGRHSLHNARRVRLVPGWVTVFGRVYHLGCHQPTRSTQPCIPPGSLNRVPTSAGG